MDAVVEAIDAALGGELAHLPRSHDLLTAARLKRESLASAIDDLTLPSSRVGSALVGSTAALKELEDASHTSQRLTRTLVDRRTSPAALESSLLALSREINTLQRIEQYFVCLRCISAVCRAVAARVDAGDVDGALDPFAALCGVRSSLSQSECATLGRIATESADHFHGVLRRALSAQGTAALATIEWPSIATAKKDLVVAAEAKVATVVDRLVRLQLAEAGGGMERREESEGVGNKGATDAAAARDVLEGRPLHAVAMLLEPVTKRFRYHFGGKRQTNRVDKPEWVFTHALGVIRDCAPFVARVVQPSLAACGVGHRDAEVEFAEGVVSLVAAKVASLLPKVTADEDASLFAHLVNETLLFERELSALGYPSIGAEAKGERGVCGRCVGQIAAPEYLERWMEAEWTLASGRFERIMASAGAWQPRYGAFEDVDDMRAPECAAQLTTVLQAVTDRYSPLRSAGDRLRFFETIQERILVEFHRELADFVEFDIRGDGAWERTQLCRLANAAFFVRSALAEWADQPFFLELHHKRSGMADAGRPLSDVTGTLFDELIGRYDALVDIALDQLCEKGHARFAAALKPLLAAKTRYLLTSADGTVDPSALMFEPLAVASEHVTIMRTALAQPLLDRAWTAFAHILSERSAYRELVLGSKFNAHGAVQLATDATALYAVFRDLSAMPENHLKELKESVILLRQASTAIHRLTRTLNGGDEHVSRRALEDLGVFRLGPADAQAVLARHLDGGAKP